MKTCKLTIKELATKLGKLNKLILAQSLFLLPISLSMLKDSNLIHNG